MRQLISIVLITAAFCALPAHGATQDDNFLAARDAFRAGDAVRLERYARTLSGYALEPYATYWQLKLRLEEATPAEIHAHIERLKDGLTGCIGCGCLSLDRCQLANPGDRAARSGPGPRYWLED